MNFPVVKRAGDGALALCPKVSLGRPLPPGLVSETFNAVLESSRGARIGARGATRFSTSLKVVSTMWTEPRNPNIAPLMPRPHECVGRVHPSARRGGLDGAGGGAHSQVDMPWRHSGGKVIPQSGQEHPRIEL